MSDVKQRNDNRSTTPVASQFGAYMATGWADRPEPSGSLVPGAAEAAQRRERISAMHPGVRLVFPAGPMKQRSNDTEYMYRAHSAFSYLTAWGSSSVPGAVLVMEPNGNGHDSTLFFMPTATRETEEFYADAGIGEFWVGARPGLKGVSELLGLQTADIASLRDSIPEGISSAAVVEADPSLVADLGANDDEANTILARNVSEMRLVKDAWEIQEMREAIASTERGFTDVLHGLDKTLGVARGERMIESTFFARARLEGNDIGYSSIVAAGPHATILHWTRNDGMVRDGELVLLDAGVERDSYYTADITRTFPVNGTFTDIQRKIYQAVLDAADAAMAIVKPGIVFREIHQAAMQVIAARVSEWGLLPLSAEESLLPENQHHRRYMVHGTSHHLGIDVHDCAQARREMYLDGEVQEGMIFTIEPGLYFQPDDLTVPAEYRGIGVRIEDNVLVTATGVENLSAGIPRTVAEVEAWVQRSLGR